MQWISLETVNYLFFIQDYFKNIDLINDKITEQGLWAIGSIIKEDLPKLSFFVEKEIYKFYKEVSETLNVTVIKNIQNFLQVSSIIYLNKLIILKIKK